MKVFLKYLFPFLACLFFYEIGHKIGKDEGLESLANSSLIDISRNLNLVEFYNPEINENIESEVALNLHRHVLHVIFFGESVDDSTFKCETLLRLKKYWQKSPLLEVIKIEDFKDEETIQSFEKVSRYVENQKECT